MDVQEEMVRLLTLQLRRTADSQAQLIREMAKAGFTPKRVAELVGTTPNSVSQGLGRGQAASWDEGRTREEGNYELSRYRVRLRKGTNSWVMNMKLSSGSTA